MTKNDFKELTKNPLLLDGATGSNSMAAGMPRGVCTETWILKHRDILKELQQVLRKCRKPCPLRAYLRRKPHEPSLFTIWKSI